MDVYEFTINFKVVDDKILCQLISYHQCESENTGFIESIENNYFEFKLLHGIVVVQLDVIHHSVYIKNNNLKTSNVKVHWHESYKNSKYEEYSKQHLIWRAQELIENEANPDYESNDSDNDNESCYNGIFTTS